MIGWTSLNFLLCGFLGGFTDTSLSWIYFYFERRGGLVVHDMVLRIESMGFEVCVQVSECTYNFLITSVFYLVI